MTARDSFLAHELLRLRFRLEVLWRAVVAATLWLGIVALDGALAGTWAQSVLWWSLAIVGILGLPVLFVQVALLTDALSYLVLNEIRFYPRFIEMARETTAEHRITPPRRSVSWATQAIVAAVDFLSPLSAIVLWVFLILYRAPATIHVTDDRPTRSVVSSNRALRRIERTVVNRAWGGAHLRVA